MASVVEICNLALQNIGANNISSLNESTTEAIECNLRYNTARRALLNMHLWNFAVKRVQLSRETATPAFNYNYQYALPADFLYMIMTSIEEEYQSGIPQTRRVSYLYTQDVGYYGLPDKYAIEGKKLLSYEEEVKIVYVADITDTEQFDGVFTELLARYLSYLISYRIVGSKSERDTQKLIFDNDLAEFQSIDSQQGTFNRIETSTFLSERY